MADATSDPAVFWAPPPSSFIQDNVLGHIFEVTSKYKAPFIPFDIKYNVLGGHRIIVWCSAFNRELNENVVMKKIANIFDSTVDARSTLREIKLLRHFYHENIVGIRDVIPPPQRESFNDVYIAYEFMDTNLHDFIYSNQIITGDHHRYFLYAILRGLKYIHSANVLHRDLKPSNLLLNTNCDLKICDFRKARITSEPEYISGCTVTRWYSAPEVLLLTSSGWYTSAMDVWSVGCIFMEILNRKPLFPGRDNVHQLLLLMELIGTPTEAEMEFLHEDAKRYIRQLPPYPRQSFTERFPNVHPEALDLAEKMLIFDPRRRITVEDALAHPYLTSLHDEDNEPICTTPFSLDFEKIVLTEELMKELLYREALAFNPEYRIIRF